MRNGREKDRRKEKFYVFEIFVAADNGLINKANEHDKA